MKKILFFLVHPAKFHFHKVQINELKRRGHIVDVVITSKDILEDLVIEEGWQYTNIFPEGRKIKGVHVYLAAMISLCKTVFRLLKYTNKKKYDLFIGDALTYVGVLKRVPALYPTDDVLSAVPEQVTWFIPASYIIAPTVTDIGVFSYKKIGYDGYKALAHLHPKYFSPDINKLSIDLQNGETFFVIRCVGFSATHDLNKTGISNDTLRSIIPILLKYGRVLISSERILPPEFEIYRLDIKKNDIAHYLAYAKLFIGDSTTMCTEAAILGTPTLEFDEYFYEIEQMLELQNKYGLINCYRTYQLSDFLKKLNELLNSINLKQEYSRKREKFLMEKINVSDFLIDIYLNYPALVHEYKRDPSIQYRYK